MIKNKKIINLLTIFLSLIFSFSLAIGVYSADALPSAQREINPTSADVVYPVGDKDKPDGGEEVVDIDRTQEIPFKLFVELDQKTEKVEIQALFDSIKQEYQDEVVDKNGSAKHFDNDIEEAVRQYNEKYRANLEEYTAKNFVLDTVFDLTVNQDTLNELAEDTTHQRYVRSTLNFGAGESKDDPLPIMLYKCEGEEWKHFNFEKNGTENWASRNEDGEIVLYFYQFCPIMVLQATDLPSPQSCLGFNWWWILIIILAIILILLILYFILRDRDDEEETVVINNPTENTEDTAPKAEEPNDKKEEKKKEVSATAVIVPKKKVKMKKVKYLYVSLAAKLALSRDKIKENYNTVKNFILKYKDVKCVESWTSEKYLLARNTIAFVKTKKKSVYLVIKASLEDFKKYTGKNVEDYKAVEKVKDGIKIRISSKKNVTLCKKLIRGIMKEAGIVALKDVKEKNYVLKKASTKKLISKKLIKVVEREVRPFSPGFGKRK